MTEEIGIDFIGNLHLDITRLDDRAIKYQTFHCDDLSKPETHN